MDYRCRRIEGIDLGSRLESFCERRKLSLKTREECMIWGGDKKCKIASARAGRTEGQEHGHIYLGSRSLQYKKVITQLRRLLYSSFIRSLIVGLAHFLAF